jgi:hypothetical protein
VAHGFDLEASSRKAIVALLRRITGALLPEIGFAFVGVEVSQALNHPGELLLVLPDDQWKTQMPDFMVGDA